MAETEIKKINGRTLCDEQARSSIPRKISQLTNDSGFLTSVPTEYVTETELNAKGYLTQHQDLSAYAKTSQIPTKVSQLTNDKNYLTAVPSEYVTETELTEKKYAKQTDVNNLSKEIADLEAETLKEADKQSIVQAVLDSIIIESPTVHAIYGEVDAEKNIILHGTLEEENYFVKYEMEDGTTVDIGELPLKPVERIIQCAYIESKDLTSYVDLGYVNTETTGMQVTFELAENGSYSGVSFFGNSDIACGATAANSDMRAYIATVKSYQLVASPTKDTEYIVGVNYQNSGKASINGTAKNLNSGTKTFKKSESLTLCKQNGGANYSRGYYTRIKEAFISEGTDIVKHYVPAYRSSDGAIGVLETNSNEFIVGTGNFVKGADV